MNQKEAVFEAVKQVASARGAKVDTDEPVILNKQEKAVVQQKLFDGFKKGKVAYNHELPSDDKLLLYVSGLVSNWLRKDKRLNGQRNYVPQRPGSRTSGSISVEGSSVDSAQMEALKQLVGANGDEVQVFVVKRSAQNQDRIQHEPEQASASDG